MRTMRCRIGSYSAGFKTRCCVSFAIPGDRAKDRAVKPISAAPEATYMVAMLMLSLIHISEPTRPY